MSILKSKRFTKRQIEQRFKEFVENPNDDTYSGLNIALLRYLNADRP